MKCAFSSNVASSFREGATGCAIKDISSSLVESRAMNSSQKSESTASTLSPSFSLKFNNAKNGA